MSFESFASRDLGDPIFAGGQKEIMTPDLYRHERRLVFHHEAARFTGDDIENMRRAVGRSRSERLAIG